MKKENGVTLFTVILTVVVALLIASTSIIVGNNLILEAKEQKQAENYEIVLEAVRREITKIEAGGVISPAVNTYIGVQNPVIAQDAEENDVYAGSDWYLLEPSHLLQLGVDNIENNYLVNYKLGILIDINATKDIVSEIEKY